MVAQARRKAARAEAWLLLLLARVMIGLLPLRWWRGRAGVMVPQAADPAPFSSDELRRGAAIGRLVRQVARRAPFSALCLPQAIAARWMLQRRGIVGRIHYGARRGDDRRPLRFHAWLMLGDHCVTGDDERHLFEPFRQQGPAGRARAADHSHAVDG